MSVSSPRVAPTEIFSVHRPDNKFASRPTATIVIIAVLVAILTLLPFIAIVRMGPGCQHCFDMRRLFSLLRRAFCTPRHRTHAHQQRRQQRHFERHTEDPFNQIRDHRRTSSFHSSSHRSFPSVENSIQLARVTRPPLSRSRRAIGLIVRAVTLPASDSQGLYSSGWTCCICLDDPVDVENDPHHSVLINGRDDASTNPENPTTSTQLPPIVRLRCSHTMHAHCLRTWLEKGRPSCCLCNGPVYPPVSPTKDDDDYTSESTSYSAIDTPANSSLIAERTEHATSSTTTSVANESHHITTDDTLPSDILASLPLNTTVEPV